MGSNPSKTVHGIGLNVQRGCIFGALVPYRCFHHECKPKAKTFFGKQLGIVVPCDINDGRRSNRRPIGTRLQGLCGIVQALHPVLVRRAGAALEKKHAVFGIVLDAKGKHSVRHSHSSADIPQGCPLITYTSWRCPSASHTSHFRIGKGNGCDPHILRRRRIEWTSLKRKMHECILLWCSLLIVDRDTCFKKICTPICIVMVVNMRRSTPVEGFVSQHWPMPSVFRIRKTKGPNAKERQRRCTVPKPSGVPTNEVKPQPCIRSAPGSMQSNRSVPTMPAVHGQTHRTHPWGIGLVTGLPSVSKADVNGMVMVR